MKRHGVVAIGVLATVAACWSCVSSEAPTTVSAEADLLRLRHEERASRDAIDKYARARDAWVRAGDARSAARAGQRIGLTYSELGLLRESLRAYEAALALAQRSGDPLLESDIRSDVAIATSLSAERETELNSALAQCESALAQATRSGGEREHAKALNCLGDVHYNSGQFKQALSFYLQAEEQWDRLADRRGRAEALTSEGNVYSDLGDLDQSGRRYVQARSLWQQIGDTRAQSILLVGEGRLQARRGEYQSALNAFFAALAELRPMGDVVWQASCLTGIATVYRDMAATEPAVKYWEESLGLFEKAGLRFSSVDILMSLGTAYLVSGEDAKALDRFERALALADVLGNPRWRAFALRHIGVVYLFRRQPGQARDYLQRSLGVQETLEDRRLLARTRADLGEAYLLVGDQHLATSNFNQALTLSTSVEDRVAQARGLFGLARTSSYQNKLDQARRYIDRSIAVVESLRSEIDNRDLRASYFASVYPYQDFRVDVLMRLDRVHPQQRLSADAFEASERARARSLLDSLMEAGVDLRAGVDPDLLRRERLAAKAFDDWSGRRDATTAARAGDSAVLAREYRDLEERYNEIEAEIRSRSPRYAALAQPNPLSLRQVQQLLDENTVLLEYALGEERSYGWAVSKTDYASCQLPPRADIERATERVYQRLTARLSIAGTPRDSRAAIEQMDLEYWQEAARLSDILLRPFLKSTKGKRLLVASDGALQYLPFGALPVPGTGGKLVPLLAEHEIVSLPSASVLGVLRAQTRGRTPPPGTVAVLADPVFESDDPRLRAAKRAVTSHATALLRDNGTGISRLASTRQEADAILAAAAPGMALKAVDFDASRATAMSPQLARYRIIHFATHGVFDNANPELSGIVLSMFDKDGQPHDGFLRLHDIYALNLPADLIVLSACNTALGKPVRGEGLVGMLRGFMYAGAKRVVATLWKVDDEATREMMGEFYRKMLKEHRSPSAALREAQLAIWRQDRWRAPFYWAAFILQGEWQ